MPYVITNNRLTVGDKAIGLVFPKGKKTISDEDYAKLRGNKVLRSLVDGGLLKAEKLPERAPKAAPAAEGAGNAAGTDSGDAPEVVSSAAEAPKGKPSKG